MDFFRIFSSLCTRCAVMQIVDTFGAIQEIKIVVHIYLLAAFTYLRVGFLMYCFILLFARAYVFTRREFLFCSFRKSLYFYTLFNLRDFLARKYLSSKEYLHPSTIVSGCNLPKFSTYFFPNQTWVFHSAVGCKLKNNLNSKLFSR